MVRANKQVKRITHEDVEKAMRAFRAKGGLITKLPEHSAENGELAYFSVALHEFGWTDLVWMPQPGSTPSAS